MEQFVSRLAMQSQSLAFLPWLHSQQQTPQQMQPPRHPAGASTFTIDEILGHHRHQHPTTSASREIAHTTECNKFHHQSLINCSQHPSSELPAAAAANASGLRGKRMRTIFTPNQLDRLEAEFERQQYMVGSERFYLANELSLTEAQVKVWFQNRRIKWRKQHLGEQRTQLMQLRLSQSSPDSSSLPEAEAAEHDGGAANSAANSYERQPSN